MPSRLVTFELLDVALVPDLKEDLLEPGEEVGLFASKANDAVLLVHLTSPSGSDSMSNEIPGPRHGFPTGFYRDRVFRGKEGPGPPQNQEDGLSGGGHATVKFWQDGGSPECRTRGRNEFWCCVGFGIQRR